MDVREAVRTAKDYVTDIYKDEGIINLGLEEIVHDRDETWDITIGFSRPWNRNKTPIDELVRGAVPDRSYKVVTIRDVDGKVMSLRTRDVQS